MRRKVSTKGTCPRPGTPRSFSETCTCAQCGRIVSKAPMGSASSRFAWKVSYIARIAGWSTEAT